MATPKLEALLDSMAATSECDSGMIAYVRQVLEAWKRYWVGLSKIDPTEDFTAEFDLLKSLCLEIGEAGDAAGKRPGSVDMREFLRERFQLCAPYQRQIGERRATMVALFRECGWGLADRGDLPRFHDDVRLEDAMRAVAFCEGAVGYEAAETVRKSIYRSRKKFRGQYLYRFDPAELRLESADAEKVLFDGLPVKRGKPRKSR